MSIQFHALCQIPRLHYAWNTVKAKGAAENYEIKYESGTLTVLPLPSYLIPHDGMTFYIPSQKDYVI